jgi:S-DNA-T family DNA segregation ATPase FtsK/SpoIIIE
MTARQVVNVRLAIRPPRWVRVLLIAGRLTRRLAQLAWTWRLELAATVAALTVRALFAVLVGLDIATVLVAAAIAGLLAWSRSRRWLVARAWCGVSRRRLLACLAETRTETSGGDLPLVVRTRPTVVGERLTLWCRVGQSAEQISTRIDALRSAVWCREVRVNRDRARGHVVTVDVIRRETLSDTVAALAVPDVVDLSAVAVGRTEYGLAWLLRLLGAHVLIAGVTGAGKGSVLWSLLRGVGPAIRSGLVQVWAVDPKGGMELGPGRALFARFAYAEYADMVELLEAAAELMKTRAARLAGHVRQHIPTPADPLIVVLVDEVANLTAYQTDRDLKRRAETALALLLTQGRAVGVTVVAALQDPRKEVLGFRNLFPVKVALRLDEPNQVDMVLGDGARNRGALADTIPETTPGVGYVREDGSTTVVRVRAGHVTDADISQMARDYAAYRVDSPAAQHAPEGAAA